MKKLLALLLLVPSLAFGQSVRVNGANLLTAPTLLGATSVKSAEPTPATPVAILVTTGTGNVTNGAHLFKVVQNTVTGNTPASAASNSVTADGTHKQITVTLPTGDGLVTSRDVCATAAGGSTYFLVTASPVVSNNTALTYTFNTADGDLTATACPSTNTTLDARLTVGGSTGSTLALGGAPQVATDLLSINTGTLPSVNAPRGFNLFGNVLPGAGSAFRIRVGALLAGTSSQLANAMAVTLDNAEANTLIGRWHGIRGIANMSGTHSCAVGSCGNPYNYSTNDGAVGGWFVAQSPGGGQGVGVSGVSSGAGTQDIGVFGMTVSPVASTTLSIGVMGGNVDQGNVGNIRVGGAFILDSGAGTNPATLFTSSAGLYVDNGAVAAPIAVLRDNGTDVVTVADGGATTFTAAVKASSYTLALTSATPADQTGNATSTLKMNGLGAAADPCVITPTSTGRVVFTIAGDLTNSVILDGISFRLTEGTGAAPANAAAATGQTLGALRSVAVPIAAQKQGFSVTGMQTGLALATAVWYDLQVANVTGGTASISNVTCVAHEI